MMLHYHPQLCGWSASRSDPPADFPPYDIYPTRTEWVPPSGVLSSAKAATPEKGKAMAAEVSALIARAVRKELCVIERPMPAIAPVKTALLVIDMQRDFLQPDGYAAKAGLDIAPLRAAIGPVSAVLAAARAAGLSIVHTREGHLPDLSDCPPYKLERSRRAGAEIGSKGPLGRLLVRGEYGHDFVDELRPLPDEIVIDKPGYSAFEHTALQQVLSTQGVDTLIVTGITTEVCVSSTLRSAAIAATAASPCATPALPAIWSYTRPRWR